MISHPHLPSIHQSIYVWFCICSSCWQYVSDFQYHDCHGLNSGRSVDSLKQQKHSGILVARQEFTKKLSCVTPIPTWKLNRIETPSASDYIITMFLLTLPWSPLRYQYPPWGWNCVTKIAPKSYQDLRYFLYINLLQFCQILSQIRVSHRNNNQRSPYTQRQTRERPCERVEIVV